MSNLDYMDLEILYRAKKSKNGIGPEDVSQQDVFTPGIWELVDKFAALQEKKLLTKNKEGLFVLTKTGMNTFWDIDSPLWLNLLKLLRVKPLSDTECAMYLEEHIPAVQQALEMIRKKGYILMSQLRKEDKLLKMFEILPEGIEQLTKIKKSRLSVVIPGDKLIVELDNGEGVLYEIIDDLVNPLRMVKTLSKYEIKGYK
jgi:DNA-binding PadR family transcriptional regulator